MNNTRRNHSITNAEKDTAPAVTDNTSGNGENHGSRASLYLGILTGLLFTATLSETITTITTGVTSITGSIQLVLMVTATIVSAYLFYQTQSSKSSSPRDNSLRILDDRIALKSHSLEILYDAAAGVTNLHGLDELLTRFLITLKNLTRAHAGLVRLLNDQNEMRLVSKTGLNEEKDKIPQLVPLSQCMLGTPVPGGTILMARLDDIWQDELVTLHNQSLTVVTVPIQYSGKTLGSYHFIVDRPEIFTQGEILQLFTSIGRHLGIVVEKVKLENHSRRISIIEERTSLANELHDSLAQTLASLRFQVAMVDETVSQSKDRTGILQIRAIKDGLDQANNQLRELLSHFRTRMDERGLIPAIESLVERFEKETGISAFFQNEVQFSVISPAVEVQVLHIVQESLTNVRKHSQAENVRVLIRSDNQGNFHVLVEDDGQGMKGTDIVGGPGEHIGLSIMQERAERLNGNLTIETEPGEGTRVELNFHAQPDKQVL